MGRMKELYFEFLEKLQETYEEQKASEEYYDDIDSENPKEA